MNKSRRYISISALIISYIFLGVYIYLKNKECEVYAHGANIIYCTLAAIILFWDRKKCVFLNEKISKELAFIFTITPLGFAGMDFIFDLTLWKNHTAAYDALSVTAVLVLWIFISCLMFFSYRGSSNKNPCTKK